MVGNSVAPKAARMGYYLVENSVGMKESQRVVPMAAVTVGELAELMDLMTVERMAASTVGWMEMRLVERMAFRLVENLENWLVSLMVERKEVMWALLTVKTRVEYLALMWVE